MDNEKKPWGCIGAVLAALITGIFTLIVADKLPLYVQNPTHTPTAIAIFAATQAKVCVIPELEKLDQAAAEIAVSQLGLNIAKSTEFNSQIPYGVVLSQTPPSGTRLNPCQGEVIIVISLGTAPTSMPPTPDPAILLINHFKEFGYEYSWSGGNTTSKYVKVLDVQINGRDVIIKYEWKNGSLHGTLTGNSLKGRWSQDGGKGDFEFIFTPDFSSATGWWSDDGKSVRNSHFLQ